MRARLGAGLGHTCPEVPVGMLPPVGHFLIDFLNLAVAQSQPQLYLLPSCQALVVQLGGGQHLQACLSHRSGPRLGPLATEPQLIPEEEHLMLTPS